MTPRISWCATSHIGNVRERNEDTIAVPGWVSGGPITAPTFGSTEVEEAVLLAVCDGLGGHQGGDIASGLVARAIAAAAPTSPESLRAAVLSAHSLLRQLADDNEQVSGMGATTAGLLVLPDGICAFNVGDSKILRLVDGYVAELSEDDRIPETASSLRQALGAHTDGLDVHVSNYPLQSGDRFLLCTDGLTDYIESPVIAELASSSLEVAVPSLLAATLAGPAGDNISIILLIVE